MAIDGVLERGRGSRHVEVSTLSHLPLLPWLWESGRHADDLPHWADAPAEENSKSEEAGPGFRNS